MHIYVASVSAKRIHKPCTHLTLARLTDVVEEGVEVGHGFMYNNLQPRKTAGRQHGRVRPDTDEQRIKVCNYTSSVRTAEADPTESNMFPYPSHNVDSM